MVEINIESNPAYGVLLSQCDSHSDIHEILRKNLVEFVHLAAFWKIVEEMAKSDIYVNAVYYNMEMNLFVREAYATLQLELGNVFDIKDSEELESLLEKYITILEDDDCEVICEPAFSGSCRMMDIVYELLDQLIFLGFEFEEERVCLYETVQELKHVNRCLIINILS